MQRRFALVVVCFLVEVNFCLSQNRLPAFEMNERLGRGINMGNSFEAPTETEWGNPWNPQYFKIISQLGFNHVRLPVRWETTQRSMASPPYTITASFLDRIQQVVDTARKYKLHIIINMHHHDALFENPANQNSRFLSQWAQIAERFKNYPDSLLFEVLNEPHGNLSPTLWNEYFADALAEIRQTNPSRVVLMGIAEFGGLGAISQLQLPNDEYIMITPHYYNPFPFTHQGAEWVSGANAWLGTKWLDTEADREAIESEFNYALHFSETNHIPVYVGEFGAYSKADVESRERWTTFLARWFEEKNLSWAYWEFSAGFGIYNPTTKQYNQGLVDALLHDEMPEATPVFASSVYSSNFSSGTDGWSLNAQGGASGTLSASASELKAVITAGGTESWHLQLVKNNIRLEKDKLYKLSFTAKAEADRSITFYAGKASSPWNAYSSASAVTISSTEATYTSTFTMTSPTDPAARLVFDLGRNVSDVTIKNVKVEALSFVVTSIEEESKKPAVNFYPNPITTHFIGKGLAAFNSAQLIDLKGQPITTFVINNDTETFDVGQIPAGIYVLKLEGDKRIDWVRIIKK
jgi:endoglucanase